MAGDGLVEFWQSRTQARVCAPLNGHVSEVHDEQVQVSAQVKSTGLLTKLAITDIYTLLFLTGINLLYHFPTGIQPLSTGFHNKFANNNWATTDIRQRNVLLDSTRLHCISSLPVPNKFHYSARKLQSNCILSQ